MFCQNKHRHRWLTACPLFLITLLTLSISGCKVITAKQAKSIQALATALKTTSSVPGVLTKQYYEINLDLQKLRIAFKPDTANRIDFMQEVLEQEKLKDSIVRLSNSIYTVLNTYAELLGNLTNDTANAHLTKQSASFLAAFDTALVKYNSVTAGTQLPLSLGKLISTGITALGAARIKHLQRKYLLGLVAESDSLVSMICDNYISVDHHIDSLRINTLHATINNDYIRFLNRMRLKPDNSSNFFGYYKDYDPLYYNWMYKADVLLQLDKDNVAAFRKLKSAHHTLLDDLNKKATRSELLERIKDLYGSVNGIVEQYNKLDKDLTPSKK